VQRQSGVDLRFGTDLQSVVERLARVEDLFDDFSELMGKTPRYAPW